MTSRPHRPQHLPRHTEAFSGKEGEGSPSQTAVKASDAARRALRRTEWEGGEAAPERKQQRRSELDTARWAEERLRLRLRLHKHSGRPLSRHCCRAEGRALLLWQHHQRHGWQRTWAQKAHPRPLGISEAPHLKIGASEFPRPFRCPEVPSLGVTQGPISPRLSTANPKSTLQCRRGGPWEGNS